MMVELLEAFQEWIMDLAQQLCPECAAGLDRWQDPIHGLFLHPVEGVYGMHSSRCGWQKEIANG